MEFRDGGKFWGQYTLGINVTVLFIDIMFMTIKTSSPNTMKIIN